MTFHTIAHSMKHTQACFIGDIEILELLVNSKCTYCGQGNVLQA